MDDCEEAINDLWAPPSGSCNIPAATKSQQGNACTELARAGSCSITACGVPSQVVDCGDARCAAQSLMRDARTEDGQSTGGSWSMNVGLGNVQVATISLQNSANASTGATAAPTSSCESCSDHVLD